MYYVNEQQIGRALSVVPKLVDSARTLLARSGEWGTVEGLAYERTVHLAVEVVTDVGSLLIDAFLMRDASSYEDIIEILHGEQVFPESMYAPLLALVKLRKPLVQDYAELDSSGPDSLYPLRELVTLLPQYAECAVRFVSVSKL